MQTNTPLTNGKSYGATVSPGHLLRGTLPAEDGVPTDVPLDQPVPVEVAAPVAAAVPDPSPVLNPQQPKKSVVLRALAGVVLSAGLISGGTWGWHTLQYAQSHEGTDDAFIDSHIVNVASRVSGPIVRLNVIDNQMLHRGDLIAQVDPADYQTALERARAQLLSAQKRLHSAQIKVQVTRLTSSADVDQASSGVGAATSNELQYVSGVSTAQMQVETSDARLEQARQQVTVARRNRDQAQAEVDAAAAGADNTHADMLRMQNLFNTEAVSQQDVDHATNAWRSAAAQMEAARKRLASQAAAVDAVESAVQAALHQVQQYQSQVGEAQAKVQAAHAQIGQAQGRLNQAHAAPQEVALTMSDVDGALADVNVAQAAVHQAELNLSYTRILATQDGRVTRRAIEPGSYVQVGQPLLALVSPHMWVTANFKETQLARMHVGQPVEINVDAYPGHVFHGHVDSFQTGSGAAFSLLPPENATGNYVKVVQRVPVKILFDQEPGVPYVLGPGMSVDPEVFVQ